MPPKSVLISLRFPTQVPFSKKQPCITQWSGTIYRLYWQSAVVNLMDSEVYGVTH
jgi:hypothetical protein